MKATRRVLLTAALLATLLASYLSASTPQAAVEPVARQRPAVAQREPRPVATADVHEPQSRSRSSAPGRAGLFAIPGWMLEQPPASAPEPAVADVAEASPPPQAPPLPFRVLGRYIEGETTIAFVQYNDLNLALRVGDSVGDSYRVDDIKGNTLYLRYLPLDQMQTLDLGPAN